MSEHPLDEEPPAPLHEPSEVLHLGAIELQDVELVEVLEVDPEPEDGALAPLAVPEPVPDRTPRARFAAGWLGRLRSGHVAGGIVLLWYLLLPIVSFAVLVIPRGVTGDLAYPLFGTLFGVGVALGSLAIVRRRSFGRAELLSDRVTIVDLHGDTTSALLQDLDAFDDASAEAVRLLRVRDPADAEARVIDVWIPTPHADGRALLVDALAAAGLPRVQADVPVVPRARPPEVVLLRFGAQVTPSIRRSRPAAGRVVLTDRRVRLVQDERASGSLAAPIDLSLGWGDVIGWREAIAWSGTYGLGPNITLVLREGLPRVGLAPLICLRTPARRAALIAALAARGLRRDATERS